MKLAVIGCGNVGANLLQHLAILDPISRVYAYDQDDHIVRAAQMDLAGVHPAFARKIKIGDRSALEQADLIVMTAGAKSSIDQSEQDVLRMNKTILDEVFGEASLKPSAIVAAIPGPVEVLAEYLCRLLDHPPEQVLGFGGDLDLNRLRYVLAAKDIPAQDASVVGEHGPRAIPIYRGEEAYREVANQVRNFLASIGQLAGVKRNLATAPLLARLIGDMLEDAGAVHCIANPHPEYGLWLTWPFHVNRGGAGKMVPLQLEPRAAADLHDLVEARRREEYELEAILSS